MGMVGSTESEKTNTLRAKLGIQAGRVAAKLQAVPKSKNLTYWSAAVLAFLIAPIAALSLSAKPGTHANLETTTPDITNTENADNPALAPQGAADGSMATGTTQNTNSASVSSTLDATVIVNGQEVPVPEKGNLNQTIVSDDGQKTHINITSNNTSTSDSTKSSLRVRTNTDSNVRIRQ